MIKRRISKSVRVGNTVIGGGAPISVQSMTNTPAADFSSTVEQMRRLEAAGCDIIRVALPDESAAEIFTYAANAGIRVPLVADVHFDYRIAVAAIRAGASKIRINPGNIGEEWKVREVADACRAAGVPIRIGVNGGSLERGLIEKYGSPSAEAIAESALAQADMLEGFGFSDIVISIKSSDVMRMIEASRIVASRTAYPLHLGVTEAGDSYSGLVKNTCGIASLLTSGIGDTIRVSLTADPVEEVRAGSEILRALGMWERGGVNIISCPTCGRTKIDLIRLVSELRDAVHGIDTHGRTVNVAVMGCVVNGPGEAREADFGIAGGDGFGVLFRNGEPEGRVAEEDIIDVLVREVMRTVGDTD